MYSRAATLAEHQVAPLIFDDAAISAPLFGALLVASIVVSLLASSIFLIPIAVWLAGRWALIARRLEAEGELTGLPAEIELST